MLDRQVARKLAEKADIRTFPTCAMCLFDLACTVLDGRTVHPGLVTRTANWVWLESADAFHALALDARRREQPGAEEALRDLDERGCRSRLVRAVVERLARQMADEMRKTELPLRNT